MNKITLRELAAHLGMGKSTVQRALAGNPHVNEAKRKQILAAAAELGYSPDVYFSTLSARHRHLGNRTLSVAYITRRPENTIPPQKGQEIESDLKTKGAMFGFEVITYHINDYNNPETMLRKVWIHGSAGMIIGNIDEETAEAIKEFDRLPVVCLIREAFLPFHTVRFSVGQAVRLCWEKLWERGYRKIGCALLRHDPEIPDDLDRLGAALALATRHLPPKNRIPPLEETLLTPRVLQNWLWKYKPDAVIGFSSGLHYHCKTQNGTPIPFVSLHANLSPSAKNISGSFEPKVQYAKLALRQLDTLIRTGEVGIPEQAQELVIHTVWHEGKRKS